MQTPIACVIMRGGTSRGPFFLASDLPADTATRDAVLLAIMGSPMKSRSTASAGRTRSRARWR